MARPSRLRADGELFSEIEGTFGATPDDWGHEYLDMIIAAKTVGSIDGSDHPYPELTGRTNTGLYHHEGRCRRDSNL